jgi:hypothetical protein
MSFPYTIRDALALRAAINANPELAEFSEPFKDMIVGPFDVLNNSVNAVANSMLVRTCFSRPHLQDVLENLDYYMAWKSTARGEVQVTVNASATVSGDYIIPVDKLKFQRTGSPNIDPLQYESREPLTISQGTTTSSVTAYQQVTRTAEIGDTDGTDFQRVDLPDLDVLEDTITLAIAGETYTRVDSYVNSGALDRQFKLYYRSDGSSFVEGPGESQDGDKYGFKPSAGESITADYATGGGPESNVAANRITVYIGGDPQVTAVNNPNPLTGGGPEESLENAKVISRLAFRTPGTFTNESSAIALAKSIDGVLTVAIVKTGTLRTDAHVMPIGGGLPSGLLKDQVADLLTRRSPLEQIIVTARDPNYVDVSVVASIRMFEGYAFADYHKYLTLAATIRISEIGEYLHDVYAADGIDEARKQINAYLSGLTGYSYSSTDNSEIEKILKKRKFQKFGEDLKQNDVINSLYLDSVDYVVVSQPGDINVLSGYITRPTTISISGI